MAVIADDSPAQEKASSAAITVIANESLAQEEGFSIDKSKKVFQPCTIGQDSDKKPSPPLEITPEPSGVLPVQKKEKKRKQRKRKRKKIKAVVVIKGPRTKPGIFSGKFHLTLPKKALRNRLIFIALCCVLQCHLTHSALNCMKSVPVSDFPIILNHNDQSLIFQNPTFCQEKVQIFGSCTACFREKCLLEIICSNVVAKEIWGKHGKENNLIRMTSEDCNHFVKKSHGHKVKRSLELSPGGLEGSETSVEEKNIIPRNKDVAEDPMLLDDICNFAVPVTDFPIVITHKNDAFTFNEIVPCPKRVDVLKICSACFRNSSLLDISCRRNRDGDDGLLWVEHGKVQGQSHRLNLTSEACQKNVKNTEKRHGTESDGGTSTENIEGSRGKSWQCSSILIIAFVFLAVVWGV
ncbi:uncharacterized protein LOC142661645 [Rhinoderma darwinii]|uniref:uncharacterized protein LOC142661645 n=1 Tax=Rhinoderma darwinii TaxID=43563 RepID=UPI003F6810F7